MLFSAQLLFEIEVYLEFEMMLHCKRVVKLVIHTEVSETCWQSNMSSPCSPLLKGLLI